MADLLQQVPITVYVAAITGLITASVTLFGVFISNRANNSRLALQISSDQQAKQKELIQDKLEELYMLFKKWGKYTSITYLNHSEVMLGSLDFFAALNIEVERGRENVDDFSRIEMLIDLYFPSLEPDYMQVDKARKKASEIILEHQKQYHAGNKDGINFLEPFLCAQNDFDAETAKFLKLIAEQSARI